MRVHINIVAHFKTSSLTWFIKGFMKDVYKTEAVKLQIRLFIKENNQPEGRKFQVGGGGGGGL